MGTRSHLASSAGKFETQAQILAMRPQVCWRPNTTIIRSLFSYSPSTVKIEANSSFSSGSVSCDLGSKK